MQISDLPHAEKSCTPAAVCPVNRNLSKFNWSPLASCSCIFIESRRGWWERKRSTLFGSKQQLPHIAHTPRVPRSKFLAQHRGRSSANLISTAQLLLQPIMLMSKERKFRCSPAAERGKERDKQGKGDFVLALALRITKERQQEFAAAREEDIPFAPLSPRLLIALTSCFRSYFLPLDRTTLPVCRITNSKMSYVRPPVWLTGIRGCVPARQQIVAPPLRE